jgi:hypothetical protein
MTAIAPNGRVARRIKAGAPLSFRYRRLFGDSVGVPEAWGDALRGKILQR